jgi:CRP/FNR family transcriptional regulator
MLSSISTSMHTRPGPAGRYRATRGDARRFVGGCTHSCLLSPLASENVALFMELTRVKRRVANGSAAYRAGESFESLLVVVSGSFKTARVSEAGEEKVTGFYFPGDTLGLNAVSDNRHVDEAIALEDSTVCAVPYSMLTDSARRVPQLHVGLLRAMSSEIVRDDGLVYLAETLTAEQRVFAFLLAMSHRYAKMGCDPERFLLRMSRRDVASYLGLSNETVSRVLTKARRDGLLWVREREIELKDIEAMSEIVGEW